MKHIETAVLMRLELAAGGKGQDWWDSLSKREQRDYIKKHPNSKYAKNARQSQKEARRLKQQQRVNKSKKKKSWLGIPLPSGKPKPKKKPKKVKKGKPSSTMKKLDKFADKYEKGWQKVKKSVKKGIADRLGRTFKVDGLGKKYKTPTAAKKPPFVQKFEEGEKALTEKRKQLQKLVAARTAMRKKYKKSLNVNERQDLMDKMKKVGDKIVTLRKQISKLAKDHKANKDKVDAYHEGQKSKQAQKPKAKPKPKKTATKVKRTRK